MATNILMPALSPTMTEGTLTRWLKKEGEAIKAGDVIAEIETDKATMEVEAVDEGVFGKILVEDGTENVAVNAPIAVLVDEGETVPARHLLLPRQSPRRRPSRMRRSRRRPSPNHRRRGRRRAANGQAPSGERIFASPLARRMAKQAGIDLSSLKGSGPNGRIVRADIQAAQTGGAPRRPRRRLLLRQRRAGCGAVGQGYGAGDRRRRTSWCRHSTMRKVIAKRLSESTATIPHFYVSMDIEIDALIALMGQLNAKSPAKDAPGAYLITINDMVIKAAAATLRKVPAVNASWTDDGMAFYDDVDISVAVSIPDGLITPIIRQADVKGLATISREMKDLAGRARAGKLKPEEFQGGGFSISNMGMFGVSSVYRDHQPASVGDPGGGGRAEAADREQGWRTGGRDGDDVHAVGRSPGCGWGVGRELDAGLQAGGRGPVEFAVVRA